MGDKGKRLTSPSDSKHRDPTASIHFESLPLVGFPLAFAATGLERLILIAAKRLGNITSSFTSGPVETARTSTWLESYNTLLLRR